jgi:GNAT superfamily N-acetyltransferase
MEYISVSMVRPNLENLPQFAMPAGFSTRMFRPGDGDTWVRIWRDAEQGLKLQDVTRKTFDENFAADLAAMEKRCIFVVAPDGRDVGTTTAWYDNAYAGGPWGRVHWVAITLDMQGKGLAKPMLAACMNLMKSLGHTRAVLGTQTPRLAAIKLYLDFGFVPDMSVKDAARAWRLVQAELHHPALSGV